MIRFLRIFSLSLAAALMAVALAGSTALAAATIHTADVGFTAGSTTVTATIDVSGLGNTKAAFATLYVFGFATYSCKNPGGNVAPGQNQISATTAGPATDLGNTEHNGRGTANLSTTLQSPTTPSPKAAGCPNGNWSVTQQSLVVTGAQLIITQQGSGTIYDSGVIDNPYQP